MALRWCARVLMLNLFYLFSVVSIASYDFSVDVTWRDARPSLASRSVIQDVFMLHEECMECKCAMERKCATGSASFLHDELGSSSRRHGTDCSKLAHASIIRCRHSSCRRHSLPRSAFTTSYPIRSGLFQNESSVSLLVKYGSIWHSIGVTWRGSFILFTARLYLDSHVYTRMSSCLMWLCFSCDEFSSMISTITMLLSILVPFCSYLTAMKSYSSPSMYRFACCWPTV